jgi:hypothetical protein
MPMWDFIKSIGIIILFLLALLFLFGIGVGIYDGIILPAFHFEPIYGVKDVFYDFFFTIPLVAFIIYWKRKNAYFDYVEWRRKEILEFIPILLSIIAIIYICNSVYDFYLKLPYLFGRDHLLSLAALVIFIILLIRPFFFNKADWDIRSNGLYYVAYWEKKYEQLRISRFKELKKAQDFCKEIKETAIGIKAKNEYIKWEDREEYKKSGDFYVLVKKYEYEKNDMEEIIVREVEK